MRAFWIGVAAIVGMLALTWIFTGNDFFLYKCFAPKQEQVRREVFEQSKAYNQGMIQDLQMFQVEYARNVKNTDAQKMIANTVTHRFADYDETKLPSDLRNFVIEMKQVSMGGN